MFASKLIGRRHVSPQDLLSLQEAAVAIMPTDHVTDCMDLYELLTNTRGLSSDKSQRIAVLALREERMTGRVRYLFHYPTASMLADALTKSGLFLQMMRFMTTGFVLIEIKSDRYVRMRRRYARTPG